MTQRPKTTGKLVEKHLNAFARENGRRHPPSDRPFKPLVLSLGGMMETDARDAFKLWKSIMTGGVYPLLSGGSPSACCGQSALLRARSNVDEYNRSS
ncbi:hypothetical protein EHS25_001829 [Saitozyma podzolica]|jgi:hypothetical protein|uniref:Uncharacterized protein n=1 Tax=Saitozyma podzolica TaxID=1890683 RepID=A0A427YFN1_9TREE|nr:hypothetical protein EHS25_001829 [Saitozyma podzolica]